MNILDINNLRGLQSDAFQDGKISLSDNEELTSIHDKLESLILIKDPTAEQFNELSLLLTKSGDLMLNTNLAAQYFSDSGSSISINFIVIAVVIISIVGIVIYKKFIS